MNKWSDLKVGDIIYMMTPTDNDKESKLIGCTITYFSENIKCKQYIIDIRNNEEHNYRIFIKFSDNDKLCLFTHFHSRSNSFRALIGLDKKELIKYYINDVRELCEETHRIFDEAYLSWQAMIKRLNYWEEIYESIKEK